MKNTIKFLVVFFLAITFQSCGDDDTVIDDNPTENAYYKVYIDGDIFSESSNPDGGIINGELVMGNNSDFTLLIYNIPEIGQTKDVNYEAWADDSITNSMVQIMGDNGTPFGYYMFSGTLTRVSKYKVTFTGTYLEELLSGPSHDFNGEIVVETVVGL